MPGSECLQGQRQHFQAGQRRTSRAAKSTSSMPRSARRTWVGEGAAWGRERPGGGSGQGERAGGVGGGRGRGRVVGMVDKYGRRVGVYGAVKMCGI